MSAPSLLDELRRQPAVAIVRTPSREQGELAALAAAAGGLRFIEITMGNPGALDILERLAAEPGVVPGVGTVMDITTARAAVDRGARYVVSPHTDETLVREVRSWGVAVIPGAATATEIVRAHRAGADLVKVFPAGCLGGPTFIRMIRGPLPHVPILVTGGIDLTNAAEYLDAGVDAVGFGSPLFPPAALEAGDAAEITRRAGAIAQLLDQHRRR